MDVGLRRPGGEDIDARWFVFLVNVSSCPQTHPRTHPISLSLSSLLCSSSFLPHLSSLPLLILRVQKHTHPRSEHGPLPSLLVLCPEPAFPGGGLSGLGGKTNSQGSLYLGFPVVTKKRPGAEPVMGTQEVSHDGCFQRDPTGNAPG